jgi:chloramphenicol 3-O-phosphotransferase
MTQVIVLNGGSSSGKSSIARALQDVLQQVWLTFGTDTLAGALPGRGDDPRSGLVLEPGPWWTPAVPAGVHHDHSSSGGRASDAAPLARNGVTPGAIVRRPR